MSTVTIKRQRIARIAIEFVPMDEIVAEQIPDLSEEPYRVLRRRIKFIQEELNCTEEEAERFLFSL